MPKYLSVISLLFLSLITFSCKKDVNFEYEYQFEIDDEIIECFNLTNEFRKSNEAWYWNEDNSTTTNLSGTLGELVLDAQLCKAAKIRSTEIIQNFSHTRPDKSECFTIFNQLSIKASSKGENIAAGNKSGYKTFLQWKEDDKDYDAQGHRRIMLGDYTKIGIAYTYDKNSEYKYYWVMILAK